MLVVRRRSTGVRVLGLLVRLTEMLLWTVVRRLCTRHVMRVLLLVVLLLLLMMMVRLAGVVRRRATVLRRRAAA